MVTLFGGKSAAFAYLLFVLLYFPCSAAIAAVYRETNLAWTVFAGSWTTLLAYLASTLFYQVTRFPVDPGYSLVVIVTDVLVLVTVIAGLKFMAGSLQRRQAGAIGGPAVSLARN